VIYINRNIIIDDIIKLSNNSFINCYKNNYYLLWKKKIDFFESYYKDYYKNDDYDFNYYNGLSYNALNIVKKINYNNIRYGKTIKRFYNIKTLNDLYNPINIEIGPVVNSIVEYIKYEFFYNNREIDYEKIFSISLSFSDYYYFIARLLFPTYYYDLFKDNIIKKDYVIISNRINSYIPYIKRIILSIKKRHLKMPFLDYIINLL